MMKPYDSQSSLDVQSRAGGNATHRSRESASRLLLFFALSYAVTWAVFIMVARFIPAQTTTGYALVLFGAYAPGMVALLLTARSEGSLGVRALLRRIVIADAPVRLYIVALTYMAGIKLTAAILHRLIAGAWPPFGTASLAILCE